MTERCPTCGRFVWKDARGCCLKCWPWHFDVVKATQAAGVILSETLGHRMSKTKLVTLMYLAERESLKETGNMITGDRMVAMGDDLQRK